MLFLPSYSKDQSTTPTAKKMKGETHKKKKHAITDRHVLRYMKTHSLSHTPIYIGSEASLDGVEGEGQRKQVYERQNSRLSLFFFFFFFKSVYLRALFSLSFCKQEMLRDVKSRTVKSANETGTHTGLKN